MFFGKIIDEIERVKEYVARWDKTDEVSEIERELVLDKLKRLYDEIKYSDRKPVVASPLMAENAEQLESAKAKTGQKSCGIPAEAKEHEKPDPEAEETNEELLGLMNRKMEQVDCGPSSSDDAGEDASALAGDETNEILLDLIGGRTEQVSCDTPSGERTEISPKASEQHLFVEERAQPRQEVNKQVILSLYGEEPATPVTQRYGARSVAGSAAVRPAAGSATTPESHPGSDATSPAAATVPATEASSQKTQKRVLGEVIAGNGTPFNERIGQQQGARSDVASKLQPRQITDLRQAIGINDKFLLLRDLFGGDNELYEKTIARLNEFTDLDDVLIYIQEHYTWNPDSAGARFLIELLERKLG